MSTNYKLRITQKEGYFALEYEEPVEKEWKEMIIRDTKEAILDIIIIEKDEDGNPKIDPETGKTITNLSPYYYEE